MLEGGVRRRREGPSRRGMAFAGTQRYTLYLKDEFAAYSLLLSLPSPKLWTTMDTLLEQKSQWSSQSQ